MPLPLVAALAGAAIVSLSGNDTTLFTPRTPPPAAPAAPSHAPLAGIVDSMLVQKRAHTLTVFQNGMPARVYPIALGNPIGDKTEIGDKKTPEGLFHITDHNPESLYHLSLKLDYPDSAHAARAKSKGASPGGDIMIHGLPPKYSFVGVHHVDHDWTLGCIAVTDQEMDELFRIVPDHTPIRIVP